jgi:hypothetical protein
MADDLEPLQTSAALDQHSEADDREDAGAQAGTNSNSDVKPELSAESWGQLGPLIPPDDGVEQVTADGGVLKKVLEPGLGDKPPLFSRCLGGWSSGRTNSKQGCIITSGCSRVPAHASKLCLLSAVHYVGRLQSTGAVFIDTKTESAIQQPVRIVAGRRECPLLCRCVPCCVGIHKFTGRCPSCCCNHGQRGVCTCHVKGRLTADAFQLLDLNWRRYIAQGDWPVPGSGNHAHWGACGCVCAGGYRSNGACPQLGWVGWGSLGWGCKDSL